MRSRACYATARWNPMSVTAFGFPNTLTAQTARSCSGTRVGWDWRALSPNGATGHTSRGALRIG